MLETLRASASGPQGTAFCARCPWPPDLQYGGLDARRARALAMTVRPVGRSEAAGSSSCAWGQGG
eukprot:6411211-Alexandrium_andersonii.AAC.1